MRRLVTWVVVTLGIAAIVRRLRRRGQQDEIAPAADEEDDPADELRRKLAETRSRTRSPSRRPRLRRRWRSGGPAFTTKAAPRSTRCAVPMKADAGA